MRGKKAWLPAAALAVVALLLLGIWYVNRPQGQAGDKTITVEVVHADESSREFTYQTSEEFLGPVLIEEGLALLKKGGTLGDLYTTSAIKLNDKGYIELDDSGQISIVDDGVDRYLGSVFPDYNLAWRNDFSWRGIHLGILFSGRIGGICYSATQANLDLYGASKATADARLAGGVLVNGREMIDAQKWYQAIGAQSGLPQYYIYDATNFRLQELSIGYTLPSKWFRDVCRLTVSAVGHNLWMIWCKAPFDPEAVASTGNNYQGIDYFMMPSLRSMGFNIKLDF